MRVLPLIFIASLFFLLSCQNEASLSINSEEKQVIFFYEDSSQADFLKEAPYYDAIIELRGLFPDDFQTMISANPKDAKGYEKYFQVEDWPALIILYQNEILVKIEGPHSKEEIIEPIVAVLSN